MYSQDAYWNYMMYHGGPPMMPPAGPPMYRPQSAAENLKSYLAMAKPAPPVAQPSPKKRIIHQSFKLPLFVSDERKVGRLSPSVVLTYKQVTDGSVPETDEYRHYLMCGECDSLRLFRQLASLHKHRQKSCSARFCFAPPPLPGKSVEEETGENAETQPVPAVPSLTPEPILEEDMETLISQARTYLETLSVDQIAAELAKTRPGFAVASGLSKEDFISIYLSAIIGDNPSSPDDTALADPAIVENDVVFDEVEVRFEDVSAESETSVGFAPISHTAPSTSDWGEYRGRAEQILKMFPTIPSHLLAVALVGDILPELKKSRTRTFGTQTKVVGAPAKAEITRSSSQKETKTTKAKPQPVVSTKSIDKQRGRRSKRLAILRRNQ